VDAETFETQVNRYTLKQVRDALSRVGVHPLRGESKSHSVAVGQGRVKDDQPKAGVRVSESEGQWHFELTEVNGDVYTYERLSMTPESFSGFAAALLDLLRGG